MYFKIISIILFINEANSLIQNSFIFSTDNSQILITNHLAQLIVSLNRTYPEKIMGISNLTKITNQKFVADKNIPFSIRLPFGNGDIATSRMDFIMASRNSKFILFQDLNLVNTPSDQCAPSNPLSQSYTSDIDDPVMDCKYSEKNFKYVETRINNEKNITKIIRYFNGSFALIGDKIYYLSIVDDKVNFTSLGIDKKASEGVVNFFIVHNEFLKNDLFAIIVKKEGKKIIYLYSISPSSEYSQQPFKYEFSERGFIQDIFKYDNITDMKMYRETLLITKNNTSLTKIYFSSDGSYSEDEIFSRGTVIIDYVIITKAIYLLEKGFGIHIIDLTSEKETVFFSHYNVKAIDKFTNPFYGLKYIGVQLEQQNDGEEYFVEFILEDEFLPRINKIFTSKKTSLLSMFTMDSFFTYLYNPETSTFTVIRRGMINGVPFETYFLPTTINKAETPVITSIYNKTTQLHSLMMIDKSNNFVILNELIFPQHYLRCTFFQGGTYFLRFLHVGEACAKSFDLEELYSFCQKIVEFKINIIEFKESKAFFAYLLVGFLLCVTIIGFGIYLCCTTHCFKENKMKVLPVNKSDKAKLYLLMKDEDSVSRNSNDVQSLKEGIELPNYIETKRTMNSLCRGESAEIIQHQPPIEDLHSYKYSSFRRSNSKLNY